MRWLTLWPPTLVNRCDSLEKIEPVGIYQHFIKLIVAFLNKSAKNTRLCYSLRPHNKTGKGEFSFMVEAYNNDENENTDKTDLSDEGTLEASESGDKPEEDELL